MDKTVVQAAGFWRRFLGFAIDTALLDLVGILLGLVLFDSFAALGNWGRLVGFSIAVSYFGVMDSAMCSGQSIGKWLMGIRVVAVDGSHLGVPQSVIRYAILGVPIFLYGLPLSYWSHNAFVFSLLSLCVFGIGLSLIYLFLFNSITRRSLHDIAVGAAVVRENSGRVSNSTVWRQHYIIVSMIFLTSPFVPSVVDHFMNNKKFNTLIQMQQAAESVPGVRYAAVADGEGKGATGEKNRFLASYVVVREKAALNNTNAVKIAKALIDTAPDAISGKDMIKVSLSYGFDIGIANGWQHQYFGHSPSEWKKMIN